MRANLAAPALVAALFGFGLTTATAQAEAVKVTPQLTIFTADQAPASYGAPTVLRGSATRRGTVHADAGYELWLQDPISGELIPCQVRRTSTRDGRFIECPEDYLPR